MDHKYVITTENVARISKWLRTRGGIAIWGSVDLSDLGRSITTPYLNENGETVTKPAWWVDNEPSRIIKEPSEVWVSVDEEVKRFHIGVRMGSQGFKVKVTDGGTRRIRKEVEKAGEGAYYVFDYDTQEAVIMKPLTQARLSEVEAKLSE